jgi:hypothetical protein
LLNRLLEKFGLLSTRIQFDLGYQFHAWERNTFRCIIQIVNNAPASTTEMKRSPALRSR